MERDAKGNLVVPILILLLLLLGMHGWLGCSPGAPSSSTTSTPAPITAVEPSTPLKEAAFAQGKKIVAQTFGLLSSNLQTALASGGISNALPFCGAAASPLKDSLAAQHQVRIRRFTQKPRNPADLATPAEAEILHHFQTSLLASTNPPAPIVRQYGSDTISFFAPILISNPVCLQCHGEPGTDVSSDHLALIRQLYPQDQATGYRPGDLRGAWRVDFSRARLESGNPPHL